MATIQAHAVKIPMLAIDKAKAKYPSEFELAKRYYPTLTDKQIARVISITAFNHPQSMSFEPIQITGAVMSDAN